MLLSPLLMNTVEIAREFDIPIGSIPKLLEAMSTSGRLTQSAVKEHAGRGIGKTVVPKLESALRKLTLTEITKLHAERPLTRDTNGKRQPTIITSVDELREAIRAEQIREGDTVEVESLVTPKGKYGLPVWKVTSSSRGTIGLVQIPSGTSDTLLLRIDNISPRPRDLPNENMLVKTGSGSIHIRIIPKQE